MPARTRSLWASACSCVALPFLTSLAAWPAVTSRAFSSPVSTNSWSTSLSITGMPAAAMTCAISPPITPAPTTAALKTNMALSLVALQARRGRSGTPGGLPLEVAAPLAREAEQAAAQRRGELAPDEQRVHQPRERRALLELVVELERHRHLLGAR